MWYLLRQSQSSMQWSCSNFHSPSLSLTTALIKSYQAGTLIPTLKSNLNRQILRSSKDWACIMNQKTFFNHIDLEAKDSKWKIISCELQASVINYMKYRISLREAVRLPSASIPISFLAYEEDLPFDNKLIGSINYSITFDYSIIICSLPSLGT